MYAYMYVVAILFCALCTTRGVSYTNVSDSIRTVLLFVLLTKNVSFQLTNADLSHDGKLLVGGLSNGVVRLWAVYHKQLLCTFRIPATLNHVFVTSDNSRIVALVSDNERKHLVVFEARNAYEYYIDRPDDKVILQPGGKSNI